MTKIKLCGLSREADIAAVNALRPDYIGFVFAKKSRRYVSPEAAARLRAQLQPGIQAVGVFVNEPVENVAALLNDGIIDVAQLHGSETDAYIASLRALTKKPVFQAFRISNEDDVQKAMHSSADQILLDAGAGTGTVFDWALLQNVKRPYFLAGGLDCENVKNAVRTLHPFAVDVSSGIETGGIKDADKMAAFVAAVRKEDRT